MEQEVLKEKIGGIISSTNTTGNKKLDKIMALIRPQEPVKGWEICAVQGPAPDKIQSIRITATGEVYSIGDKIQIPYKTEPLTIEKFELDKNADNGLSVIAGGIRIMSSIIKPYTGPVQQLVSVPMTDSEYRLWREWVDGGHGIQEEKRLVLVTEDGSECRDEEEIVQGVNTNSWGIATKKVREIEHHYKQPQWKWFSSPEARQEYIEYEKPVLNQREVSDLMLKVSNQYTSKEYMETLKCALDTYVMEKLKQ
jgi:hypothetical protein